MTFLDFIGFFIAIVAFFFLMAKQAKEQRRRLKHPEEYEVELKEQEEALKKLLGDFGEETEAQEVAKNPPPPPARREKVPLDAGIAKRLTPQERTRPTFHKEVFRAPHEKHRDKVADRRQDEIFLKPHEVERVRREAFGLRTDDAYKIQEVKKSRMQIALGEAGSLKKAIIFREILGSPKAMKNGFHDGF